MEGWLQTKWFADEGGKNGFLKILLGQTLD
jgi:hypothetical protein